MVVVAILGIILILIGVFLFLDGHMKCDHQHTICLHVDDIGRYQKWWHQYVRRQLCLVCKSALKRPAICAHAGSRKHEWEGDWPSDWK